MIVAGCRRRVAGGFFAVCLQLEGPTVLLLPPQLHVSCARGSLFDGQTRAAVLSPALLLMTVFGTSARTGFSGDDPPPGDECPVLDDNIRTIGTNRLLRR